MLTNQIQAIIGFVQQALFTYKKIIHRPEIVLKPDASESDVRLARKLAEKAEKSCMISRGIQGNVEMKLEVTVRTAS